MAETLSEKIRAINQQHTQPKPKKEKTKTTPPQEKISPQPHLADEYYANPKGWDWTKWLLLLLAINGILLAFALGRFILLGI